MQIIHPVSAYNKPQIKSRNTMILLLIFTLDQDKSCQKLLSLELGYIYLAYCTLKYYVLHVIFALDI